VYCPSFALCIAHNFAFLLFLLPPLRIVRKIGSCWRCDEPARHFLRYHVMAAPMTLYHSLSPIRNTLYRCIRLYIKNQHGQVAYLLYWRYPPTGPSYFQISFDSAKVDVTRDGNTQVQPEQPRSGRSGFVLSEISGDN
jgi:hypothetical protein